MYLWIHDVEKYGYVLAPIDGRDFVHSDQAREHNMASNRKLEI